MPEGILAIRKHVNMTVEFKYALGVDLILYANG